MWNISKVTPLGQVTLEVLNPKNTQVSEADFIVVPNDFSCLLGLITVQEMELFTINKENFIAEVTSDTSQLGNLGEAKLHVNSNVTPRALTCRNLPFALQEDVKNELDRLVKIGVLAPVDEPTEWISQMAVVKKPYGSLRICIDPQPLNEALQREYYRLPTFNNVLPTLNNAKIVRKLDIKHAFWHVQLDSQSSLLKTMITPFGRYRCPRHPFGLKVSSEIFQRKLNEALRELQKRCSQRNIMLNDEKSVLKQTQVKFMGHMVTTEGVQADQSKVEAILNMPAPTDVHGVTRLCGMIQYLSKFLPNLASDLQPIRELTRTNVDWNWSAKCEETFIKVKKKVTEAPLLIYFNPDKELVLQVDSSKDGLGAALLQDGKPIEYASRALTSAEQNWAQIEKETLAVVFGLERLD